MRSVAQDEFYRWSNNEACRARFRVGDRVVEDFYKPTE